MPISSILVVRSGRGKWDVGLSVGDFVFCTSEKSAIDRVSVDIFLRQPFCQLTQSFKLLRVE